MLRATGNTDDIGWTDIFPDPFEDPVQKRLEQQMKIAEEYVKYGLATWGKLEDDASNQRLDGQDAGGNGELSC